MKNVGMGERPTGLTALRWQTHSCVGSEWRTEGEGL